MKWHSHKTDDDDDLETSALLCDAILQQDNYFKSVNKITKTNNKKMLVTCVRQEERLNETIKWSGFFTKWLS